MEYITMRNGTKVPMLGLGCYKSEEQEGVEAVKSAIEIGYRHIDTANFYENEKYVGRGIRESGIDREKLFVVSKIWPTSFKTPEVAIEYSMRALNIDYIDMYLLHWPSQNEYARNILNDPKLVEIAEKHGKNVGQVILRWNIQRGNCVIPKSSKPHRIADNFNIFDFELDADDMAVIGTMENGNSYCSDSSVFTGDFWNIEDHLLNRE